MIPTPCSVAAVAAARTSDARRRALAGERGREERKARRRRAARAQQSPCPRCGRPRGRDDAADDLRVDGVGGRDRIERRSSHRRIGVVEERDQPVAPPRRREPAAAPVVSEQRERARATGRRPLPAVADRRELPERPHADLRIRVLGEAAELDLPMPVTRRPPSRSRPRRTSRGSSEPSSARIAGTSSSAATSRRRCDERAAAHLVGERARVRPVHADGDHRPDHAAARDRTRSPRRPRGRARPGRAGARP